MYRLTRGVSRREGFVVGGFRSEGIEIAQGFGGHPGTQAGCALDLLELVVEIEDLVGSEAMDIFEAPLGETFFFEGRVKAGGGGDQDQDGYCDEGPIAAEEFGSAINGGGGAGLDGS